MAKETKKENKTFFTPVGRLIYPHILKPQRNEQDTHDVYSLQLNVPKENGKFPSVLNEMKSNLEQALQKKWGDDWADDVELPFKDGDTHKALKKRDFNHGCICVDLRSYDQQPGIGRITKSGDVVDLEQAELKDYLYAGAKVVCTYNWYTYDTGKKRGITVGLRTVVVVGHGEKITIAANASADFDGVKMSDFAKEMYADDDEDDSADEV